MLDSREKYLIKIAISDRVKELQSKINKATKRVKTITTVEEKRELMENKMKVQNELREYEEIKRKMKV